MSLELPLKYDLYLYHGDSYVKGFRLRDQDTQEYRDLTDAVLLSQVRQSSMSPSILFEFDIDLANQEDENTIGMCYFRMTDANFVGIPRFPDETFIGVYDFEVTWSGGPKITYLYGDVYVKGDVSQ